MTLTSPTESNDLVPAWDDPAPVATLSIDQLKAEAVHLKFSIDKGDNVMREWRLRLGEILTEIKRRVGHGHWLPYIETNLPIEQRQVRNYLMLAENRQRVTDMPMGMSMREELQALRRRTEPQPTPLEDGVPDGEGGIDGEAPRSPLLRFALPDTPTHVLVESMLLTFFPDALTVLDTCYGNGNFWGGSSAYRVTGHDLEPERAPDGVMDCTDLEYDDASFDVVIFDPPHLADGGDDSEMTSRFGTVVGQGELDELILQGTREAWRVCDKGIIVKVTDHVHGRMFQEESLVVSEALGWAVPYDKVYQVREHAFIDPSWKLQCSAYNNGAVYLVYRKGDNRHIPRSRPEA